MKYLSMLDLLKRQALFVLLVRLGAANSVQLVWISLLRLTRCLCFGLKAELFPVYTPCKKNGQNTFTQIKTRFHVQRGDPG